MVNYNFIGGYTLCIAIDWLTGPYLYETYKSNGFSDDEIASMFIVGNLSALILGTLISTLSMWINEKNMCVLYIILSMVSILLILYDPTDLKTQLIGRVVGGINTSLLYTSFESYVASSAGVVVEKTERSSMHETFAEMVICNAVVAIGAGGVVSLSPDTVLPFNIAVMIGCIAFLYVTTLWGVFKDNTLRYQSDASHYELTTDITRYRDILTSPGMIHLICIQTVFEATMNVFVVSWIQGLDDDGNNNNGVIFATFMIASAIGSQLHSYVRIENVVLCTMCSYFIVWSTKDVRVRYIGFVLHEICIGMYFPLIARMRSNVNIMGGYRTVIYNILRVPSTLLTVAILMSITFESKYLICLVILLIASIWIR